MPTLTYISSNEELLSLLTTHKVVAVEERQFRNSRYYNNLWMTLSLVLDDGSFIALCTDDLDFLHVKELA